MCTNPPAHYVLAGLPLGRKPTLATLFKHPVKGFHVQRTVFRVRLELTMLPLRLRQWATDATDSISAPVIQAAVWRFHDFVQERPHILVLPINDRVHHGFLCAVAELNHPAFFRVVVIQHQAAGLVNTVISSIFLDRKSVV